jgi:hypothetical protein
MNLNPVILNTVVSIFTIHMNLNPVILKMEAAISAEMLKEASCTV